MFQVEWRLQLAENNVLDSLLNAFSCPDTITYQGEGYNLTKAYDTFWTQFYDNPVCSDKYRKLPKLSLGNEKLRSLARIIKRGWQDERYLPANLSESFLRSCFFGKQSSMDISAEMILDFIGDDEGVKAVKKNLKRRKEQLDIESLKVLHKCSPDASLSVSNLVEEACITVVQNILDELDEVVQEWNKELKDLLDLKEFNFVMKQREACLSREPSFIVYDDLTGLEKELPHVLWTTFFEGWSTGQIDFYFKMLSRNTMTCDCGGFASKHFMGNDASCCGNLMSTLRHDWVLREIKEKLEEAMCKEGTFFSSADDWKFLERFHSKNQDYTWPEELGMEFGDKTPHLLVYSTTPQKKVMIVEASVMWEEWYKTSPDQRMYKTKTAEFESTVRKLEKNGFEVVFRDVEMGCRGVLSRKLYELLNEDFKMEHGEVSKTMEEVSKGIVGFAYNKFVLSNKVNDESSRTSSKRKSEDEKICPLSKLLAKK